MSALEITAAMDCPNRCRFCPEPLAAKNYAKGDTRVLHREDFTRFCATIPLDVPIQFNGAGEPFQNPELVDLVLDRYREGHR